MAETGGFFDQPNVYVDIMSTIESAVADTMSPDFQRAPKEEDDKVEALKSIGIPIIQKKG